MWLQVTEGSLIFFFFVNINHLYVISLSNFHKLKVSNKTHLYSIFFINLFVFFMKNEKICKISFFKSKKSANLITSIRSIHKCLPI